MEKRKKKMMKINQQMNQIKTNCLNKNESKNLNFFSILCVFFDLLFDLVTIVIIDNIRFSKNIHSIDQSEMSLKKKNK